MLMYSNRFPIAHKYFLLRTLYQLKYFDDVTSIHSNKQSVVFFTIAHSVHILQSIKHIQKDLYLLAVWCDEEDPV